MADSQIKYPKPPPRSKPPVRRSSPPPPPPEGSGDDNGNLRGLLVFSVAVGLMILAYWFAVHQPTPPKELSYPQFVDKLQQKKVVPDSLAIVAVPTEGMTYLEGKMSAPRSG